MHIHIAPFIRKAQGEIKHCVLAAKQKKLFPTAKASNTHNPQITQTQTLHHRYFVPTPYYHQ